MNRIYNITDWIVIGGIIMSPLLIMLVGIVVLFQGITPTEKILGIFPLILGIATFYALNLDKAILELFGKQK